MVGAMLDGRSSGTRERVVAARRTGPKCFGYLDSTDCHGGEVAQELEPPADHYPGSVLPGTYTQTILLPSMAHRRASNVGGETAQVQVVQAEGGASRLGRWRLDPLG